MSSKDILTQGEAERSLNMLKKSLTKTIDFPSAGSSQEFKVVGDTKNDLFVINIYRGRIKKAKYNFGARIQKDNTILLELHIGATNIHINPDGEKIEGSHWHIYKEGYGRRFAFIAEDLNDANFVENTIKFFDKFNLIEKPDVNYQLELI